jgi:glycosyltransferase involved in cell wall biosynthesis
MTRSQCDERMKIALIVPGGVDRSGEYRVIPALLALLRRLTSKHEVHVFCFAQEPQPSEYDLVGARIHNIGGWHRARMARLVLREHARSPFSLIHSIWSGTCSLIAVSIAKLLRIPSIVHVAGGELAAIPDIAYGGFLSWRGQLRERAVLRRASAVTAASPFIIDSISQLRVAAQRVPLGVDLETWPARAPLPRDTSRSARLLHVASINRVKDQTTLLRALAELRNYGQKFHLDFVGEDTLNGEIQALADKLGLRGAITFHGFMTQRQWRPLAEASDLLLMSSLHEAGPLVVLEAAVVGVPTVGTAVGHIAEWAPTAARAVPLRDTVQFADAIRSLLIDDDLRLRIAKAAFERATREDADQTARAFMEIYERLTAGSSSYK